MRAITRLKSFPIAAVITAAMLSLALLVVASPTIHQEALALGKGITVVNAKGKTMDGVVADFDEETKEVIITTEQDTPCVEVSIKDVDGHQIASETVESGTIEANSPLSITLHLNKRPARAVIISKEAAEARPSSTVVGTAVIIIGAVIAVVSYRKIYHRRK